MVSKDDVQRYLDAGIAFTTITRARAEELVAELVKSGTFQSSDARAKVDELIERSRKGRELVVAQIRSEVTSQLGSLGITSLDDLAREVAEIINRTAEAGRAATDKVPGTRTAPASTGSKAKGATSAKKTGSAAGKKAAAGKTGAGKTGAGKTGAGKTAAGKATAKKSAERPTTDDGTPTSGTGD